MGYLYIKDWSEFQHYKDRNPPWIKLNTNTFQNYEFSRLQDASKLLAVCIWTLASRSKEGKIPCDLEWVKQQCGLSDYITITHLKELIDKGYLIDASNALASCKQVAIPETETETETETEVDIIGLDKSKPHPPKKILYSDDFEEFWKEYPKTADSKLNASKKYNQAIATGVTHDELFSAVGRFKKFLDATGTPAAHPSTWLHQRRWEVDYNAAITERNRTDGGARAAQVGNGQGGYYQAGGGGYQSSDTIPKSKWTTAAEELIAKDRAKAAAASQPERS